MQIQLSSSEIKTAILASLSGSISMDNKSVTVTFTSGRSKNDLTATVNIEDRSTGEQVEIPGYSDGTGETNAVTELGKPFTEPFVGEAAADTASASTTGTLFKKQ